MKKFLIMALVALTGLCASAQRNFFIGGQAGYVHDGSDNTNRLTILPEIGYDLNSKWTVGTTIGWDYTHFCRKDISTNLFRFNPYVKYTYFRSESNLVSLYVDGTVGVGLGWTHVGGDDTKTACVWQIGLRPGVSLNLTPEFSMTATIGFIGYQGVNNAAKPAYHSRGGIDLNGNNLTLGFYYHF